MVKYIKTLYEKIMIKEMRKNINDPKKLCPFDGGLLIYLLIAGIWLTLLIIAFIYA